MAVDAETHAAWHALRHAQPVFWAGRQRGREDEPAPLGAEPVATARARIERCAPVLARLFPELAASAGVIESPLLDAPRLQQAIGLDPAHGTLFVKADHALPVAGSIKARGAFHEVLEFAERCVQHAGVGGEGASPALDAPEARAVLAAHEVAVGSTGNLGLAIGVMAAALGLRAVVHMSADAKAWKKARLRSRGVHVVEHAGDYAQAVAAGRAEAAANPKAHFVDDEQSRSLFVGYAAAARALAAQLAARQRAVDASHPLFVYLPCGVGGAPGGIAAGLHLQFGRHAHCVFVEPVQSPCFLLRMLVDADDADDADVASGAGPRPETVYDVGLTNRTEADGLAVPRASELAAGAVRDFLAGVCTVDDDELFRLLYLAHGTEGLRIEPSAAAAFAGPQALLHSPAGRDYLRRQRLDGALAGATHVAWTTGGLFVPPDEYARLLARGERAAQARGQPIQPLILAPKASRLMP